MDNLEYLEYIKKNSYREYTERSEIELRKTYALEIIAEELCKFNERAVKIKKELDEAYKL